MRARRIRFTDAERTLLTRKAKAVGRDRDEIEAALGHCRKGIDFVDALQLAASKACSELLTFDDRGYARRAKRLRLKPPVRVPTR